MRVAISDETLCRYHGPTNYSIQYLRMTPLSGPTQRVLSWKLSTPGNLRPWTDTYGNAAHVLVLDQPHEEIRITAIGEVEIADAGKALLGDGEPHAPELFLRSTRLTEADEAVRRFADGFKPAIAGNVRQGLDALMAGIGRTIEYRPGLTQTSLSAREALNGRVGLSQDHAHLFLSCCRSLGVPARFVAGYLCADGTAPASIASHAWAEAWIDGAGWLSYDVANRMSNAKAHVRMAIGLDSLDAGPLRGVARGGGEFELDVTVSDARAPKLRPVQQ